MPLISRVRYAAIALALLCAHQAHAQSPLGTAFTYQGLLKQDGAALNGGQVMQFRLFDRPSFGFPIAPPLTFDGLGGNPPPVSVVNGLFTVTLDFGFGVFNGDARWLQISVAGTDLSPRQELSAAPYALGPWAVNAQGVSHMGSFVGIGTSAPEQGLTLRGGMTIDFGNTNNGNVAVSDNNAIVFGPQSGEGISSKRTPGGNVNGLDLYTDHAARISLTNGGNVGIRTTSPQQTLDIDGTLRVRNGVIQRGGTPITNTTDLGLYSGANGDYLRLVTTNAPHQFYTDGGSGGTPAMTLTAAGSLGIGTQSPGQRLSVNGTIESVTGGFKFPDGTTQTTSAASFWHSNGSTISNSNSGAVGIGTNSPAGYFDVSGQTQSGLEAVDQQQTLGGDFRAGFDHWQSFTPGVTGLLTRIDVLAGSPSEFGPVSVLLRVYSGDGTGGTLLLQQNVTLQSPLMFYGMPLSSYQMVTAGSRYTFRLTAPFVDQRWFESTAGNPYPGGHADINISYDYAFKTYVAPITASSILTILPGGGCFIGGGAIVDGYGVSEGSLAGGLRFGAADTGTGIVSRRAAGPNQLGLDLVTDSVSRLSITNGGQVGIGISNPSQRLSVAGMIESTTGGFKFPDGTTQITAVEPESPEWTPNGDHIKNTNSGNVGIGTVGDAITKLDINGGLQVTGGIIQRGGGAPVTGTTDLGLYSQGDGNWLRFVTRNGDFNWYTDAGAGTNSILKLTSIGTLNIDASGQNAGFDSFALRFGESGSGEYINSRRLAGANRFGLDFNTAGVIRMSITNNGSVGIATNLPDQALSVVGNASKSGGGSWATLSDARLKHDVHTLAGSLDQLLSLRGVSFVYNDPESIDERAGRRIGMIAQEVETVFPDWVETGNRGYKSVTYRGFEALAVEALRDLRSEKDRQIQELQVELTALRSQVKELVAERDRYAADIAARLSRIEAQAAGPARLTNPK